MRRFEQAEAGALRALGGRPPFRQFAAVRSAPAAYLAINW
jgi:hypothetical protein